MSGWVAPSRLGFGWGGWHPYTWVYCGLILFTRQLNLLRLHRLQIAPNARQLILATLTSARSRQGLVGVGGTLTSGRGEIGRASCRKECRCWWWQYLLGEKESVGDGG